MGAAGTEEDPYIIANWTIDATGTKGIYIDAIWYCFAIRNCTIYGAGGGFDRLGIHLNCIQGFVYRVENCTIYDTGGIYIYFGENHTIAGNVLHDNDIGLKIYYSNNNVVTQNKFTGANTGIALDRCNHTQLMSNNCSGNGGGISLYASNSSTITNNTIVANSGYGVVIGDRSTANDVVTNNCSSNGWQGFYLQFSGNIIHHNYAVYNIRGCWLQYNGLTNDFHDNTCEPPNCCGGGAPLLYEWHYVNGNVTIYRQVDRFQFSGCDYSFYLGVTFLWINQTHEDIVVHGFVFAETRTFMANMGSSLYFDTVITYLGLQREGHGVSSDTSAFWMSSSSDSHIEIYSFPLCHFLVARNTQATDLTISITYRLTSTYYDRQGTLSESITVPTNRGHNYGTGDPATAIYVILIVGVIVTGVAIGIKVIRKKYPPDF